MKVIKFIPTGHGAHGLQVSRDARDLYVSNRLEGSISVIDFVTRQVVAKWRIPGGGSPDMLQLNPDGSRTRPGAGTGTTDMVFSMYCSAEARTDWTMLESCGVRMSCVVHMYQQLVVTLELQRVPEVYVSLGSE